LGIWLYAGFFMHELSSPSNLKDLMVSYEILMGCTVWEAGEAVNLPNRVPYLAKGEKD
jgi:hypothetical protein